MHLSLSRQSPVLVLKSWPPLLLLPAARVLPLARRLFLLPWGVWLGRCLSGPLQADCSPHLWSTPVEFRGAWCTSMEFLNHTYTCTSAFSPPLSLHAIQIMLARAFIRSHLKSYQWSLPLCRWFPWHSTHLACTAASCSTEVLYFLQEKCVRCMILS